MTDNPNSSASSAPEPSGPESKAPEQSGLEPNQPPALPAFPRQSPNPAEPAPQASAPQVSAPYVSGSQASAPQASAPSVFARALKPERLVSALIAVGITIAASYVIVLILSVLTIVSLEEPGLWSIVAGVPLHLMGASLFGTITGSLSIAVLSVPVGGSVIAFWVPLLILLIQAGASYALAARAEKRVPSDSAGVRWLVSLVQGAAYAVLMVVLTLVASLTFETEGSVFSATTASISLFFGSLLVVTIAAALARARVARSVGDPRPLGVSATVPPSFVVTLRLAFGYAFVASVVGGIAALIAFAAQAGPKTILSAPLWLPTAALDALSVMHFGQVAVSGSAAGGLASPSASTSVWIGSAPLWVVLIDVVIVLVLLVLAGVWLRLARAAWAAHGRTSSSAAQWGSTIGSFALMGLVVTALGSIAASGSAAGISSGTFTVGPALWSILLFAAVGALVEVSARFAAGLVLGLLPVALVSRLSRLAVSTSGPGRSAATTTSPASGPAASAPATPLAATFAAASAVTAPAAASGDVRAGAPGASTPGVPPTPGSPASPENADQASTLAYPTSVIAPVATPLDPRTKKRVIVGAIVGGGVLVLLIVATVGLSVANSVLNAPQAKVSAYLDALVEGKASRALSLADVDAPSNERILLTDAIFSAAEERITSYTISNVNVYGDSASVAAEVDQDGRKSTMRFDVSSSGKQWLFFDEWTLDRPDSTFVSISIPEALEEVQVNGVDLDLSGVDRDGSLRLPSFPGTYEFTVAESSKWLTAEPQSVTVAADSSPVSAFGDSVRLEPRASDALSKDIEKQVDAYLATCIASTSLDPDNCPNSYYGSSNTSNVAWSLTKKPVYEIKINHDGELTVSTTEQGSASVSYRYTSFGERDATGKAGIRVSGTVEIEGEKATFVPDTDRY